MKLSVILPARNEEYLIRQTLKDILSYLKKQNRGDYEILVVINGSSDSTDKYVSEFCSKESRVKKFASKPGYGIAIKKGLKEAKGKYVVIFNVDFYDLRMLDLASIDLYGKDLIVGSKMAHWSEDKRPMLRKFISFAFNLYLKLFYDFKGSDTHGIKIMRRTVVEKVLPKCRTSSGIFDTEFVLRAQRTGFKIADFPVAVEEKRPPRFVQRLLQTPIDIISLHQKLEND